MFGKKKSRTERSFSVMLAEETLRAELKKLYGDGIKIFQNIFVAGPPVVLKSSIDSITDFERTELEKKWMKGTILVREVEIEALVGPFERIYPDNPPEDRRRRLRPIDAICRIYSFESGSCSHWQVHYLHLEVFEGGEIAELKGYDFVYENGLIRGERSAKNTDFPCQEMINSQICAQKG